MSVLFILGVVPYLTPTGIAAYRNHPQATTISLVNLFLGWTVLGWIAALVWSLSGEGAAQPVAADGDEVGHGVIKLQGRDPRRDRF